MRAVVEAAYLRNFCFWVFFLIYKGACLWNATFQNVFHRRHFKRLLEFSVEVLVLVLLEVIDEVEFVEELLDEVTLIVEEETVEEFVDDSVDDTFEDVLADVCSDEVDGRLGVDESGRGKTKSASPI